MRHLRKRCVTAFNCGGKWLRRSGIGFHPSRHWQAMRRQNPGIVSDRIDVHTCETRVWEELIVVFTQCLRLCKDSKRELCEEKGVMAIPKNDGLLHTLVSFFVPLGSTMDHVFSKLGAPDSLNTISPGGDFQIALWGVQSMAMSVGASFVRNGNQWTLSLLSVSLLNDFSSLPPALSALQARGFRGDVLNWIGKERADLELTLGTPDDFGDSYFIYEIKRKDGFNRQIEITFDDPSWQYVVGISTSFLG